MYYEDSSSIAEKFALLAFIAAITIGNIFVFVIYLLRSDWKHWSNMFILGMACIDLFIGNFVLPMRFASAYGNLSMPTLCKALTVGESGALATIIYSIAFMIYVRLFNLKRPGKRIQRRYIVLLLIATWMVWFLFYAIPFMVDSSSDLREVPPVVGSKSTDYCTNYTMSAYHPAWLVYTEIGGVYAFPLLCIFVGLIFLLRHLCQQRPKVLHTTDCKQYVDQKKMTWHVLILTLTFICLWSPWITVRILMRFFNTDELQRALQTSYYIMILKSVLFPVLYMTTNPSFRGSFLIYRQKRMLTKNRIGPMYN